MSNVICTDDRFEVIAKYKAKLLEKTNIETSADEMAVIDNILFRMWQIGWLDRLEQPTVDAVPVVRCQRCKHYCGEETYTNHRICKIWNEEVFANGYCYHGERKDGEHDNQRM